MKDKNISDQENTKQVRKLKDRSHPIMTDNEYLVDRLENQMNWFDRKSSFHQKRYKLLKRWEVGIGACIPVLITFSASCDIQYQLFDMAITSWLQLLATLGGVFLVMITKQLELEEHLKFWKDYRTNAEQLQYQLMLYKTCTAPYDDEDAYHNLVSNIENLLNQENMKWQQSGQEKKPEEQDDDE